MTIRFGPHLLFTGLALLVLNVRSPDPFSSMDGQGTDQAAPGTPAMANQPGRPPQMTLSAAFKEEDGADDPDSEHAPPKKMFNRGMGYVIRELDSDKVENASPLDNYDKPGETEENGEPAEGSIDQFIHPASIGNNSAGNGTVGSLPALERLERAAHPVHHRSEPRTTTTPPPAMISAKKAETETARLEAQMQQWERGGAV